MNGMPTYMLPGLSLDNQQNMNQLIPRSFGNNQGFQLGQNQGQSGFGLNMPTFQLGANLLGGLGGLWSAFQMNNLAKKQFNLSEQAYKDNMRNQTQSYNTSLEDRIRARMAAEGRPQADADEYLNRNRL